MKITPPGPKRRQIKQDTEQNPGGRPEDIDGANGFPPAAVITQHGFPAPVHEMNALEHLFVSEIIERFKTEEDGPAAEAAKQTEPLLKRAFSQYAMRKFPDLDPRIAAAREPARTLRVSRPDVKINGITLSHR
jgi:hypothetical protein